MTHDRWFAMGGQELLPHLGLPVNTQGQLIVALASSVESGNIFQVLKFGGNFDVDYVTNGDTDIVAHAGFGGGIAVRQYWPTAAVLAANIDIYAGGANDTLGGTGMQKCEIQGIGGAPNYQLQSEEVDLAGLGIVHPTLDYYRIFRAKGVLSGSNQKNFTNIIIEDSTQAAGQGVMASIPAGKGQTEQAMYTVPGLNEAGDVIQDVELRYWYADLILDTGVASEVATVNLQVRTPGSNTWRSNRIRGISDVKSIDRPFEDVTEIFVAGTDIVIAIIGASADSLPITAGFDLKGKIISSA